VVLRDARLIKQQHGLKLPHTPIALDQGARRPASGPPSLEASAS
jgi:hypothetical protein